MGLYWRKNEKQSILCGKKGPCILIKVSGSEKSSKRLRRTERQNYKRNAINLLHGRILNEWRHWHILCILSQSPATELVEYMHKLSFSASKWCCGIIETDIKHRKRYILKSTLSTTRQSVPHRCRQHCQWPCICYGSLERTESSLEVAWTLGPRTVSTVTVIILITFTIVINVK